MLVKLLSYTKLDTTGGFRKHMENKEIAGGASPMHTTNLIPNVV